MYVTTYSVFRGQSPDKPKVVVAVHVSISHKPQVLFLNNLYNGKKPLKLLTFIIFSVLVDWWYPVIYWEITWFLIHQPCFQGNNVKSQEELKNTYPLYMGWHFILEYPFLFTFMDQFCKLYQTVRITPQTVHNTRKFFKSFKYYTQKN